MTRYDGNRFLADPYVTGKLDALRDALAVIRALPKSKSRDQAEQEIIDRISDILKGKGSS